MAKFWATSRMKVASSISPLNQRSDASTHSVRPTMKPLTMGLVACAKLSARYCSGWFRPRMTAPRQCGSRSATSAASAVQPSALMGASFHHSGFSPKL